MPPGVDGLLLPAEVTKTGAGLWDIVRKLVVGDDDVPWLRSSLRLRGPQVLEERLRSGSGVPRVADRVGRFGRSIGRGVYGGDGFCVPLI